MKKALLVLIAALVFVFAMTNVAFAGGGAPDVPVIGRAYDAYQLSSWCKGWRDVYPRNSGGCYMWREGGNTMVAFGESTSSGQTLFFGKVTRVIKNQRYLNSPFVLPVAVNNGIAEVELYIAPQQRRVVKRLK